MSFLDGMIILTVVVALSLMQLAFVRWLINGVVRDTNRTFTDVNYVLNSLASDVNTLAGEHARTQPPTHHRRPSNVVPFPPPTDRG